MRLTSYLFPCTFFPLSLWHYIIYKWVWHQNRWRSICLASMYRKCAFASFNTEHHKLFIKSNFLESFWSLIDIFIFLFLFQHLLKLFLRIFQHPTAFHIFTYFLSCHDESIMFWIYKAFQFLLAANEKLFSTQNDFFFTDALVETFNWDWRRFSCTFMGLKKPWKIFKSFPSFPGSL